ncbi:hypothetical protein P170DRAFT_23683 [Aspergillus steynii IBT 23096]|uniref:Uncharacterized protein n=1 Tax=Aspergillus steynii IBT 23096 TaxID=1392250 RepID=A0A2I2GP76_9EURO|nr:uncharacterized protein P170DRAFT_23683 [Aspergillus steynii IBT 23096]PLB54676.1 hypothetical protein P170DRAFT_23683 [Aspergillus steynii IBT 23096]
MAIRLKIWDSEPPKPIVSAMDLPPLEQTKNTGSLVVAHICDSTCSTADGSISFSLQLLSHFSAYCRYQCGETVYVPTRRNNILSPLLGSDSFGRSVTQDAHNIATGVRIGFSGKFDFRLFPPLSPTFSREANVQVLFCLPGNPPVHIQNSFGVDLSRPHVVLI